jgi:hypothetical protein
MALRVFSSVMATPIAYGSKNLTYEHMFDMFMYVTEQVFGRV